MSFSARKHIHARTHTRRHSRTRARARTHIRTHARTHANAHTEKTRTQKTHTNTNGRTHARTHKRKAKGAGIRQETNGEVSHETRTVNVFTSVMHHIKGNVAQRETVVLEDNEHIHLIKEMLIMPVFRFSSAMSNTNFPVGVCFLALCWKIINLKYSILWQDSVVNRNAYILSVFFRIIDKAS